MKEQSERNYWVSRFDELDREFRSVMEPFNKVRVSLYAIAMPKIILDTKTGEYDFSYAFPEAQLKLLEQIAEMEKYFSEQYSKRYKELWEHIQRSEEKC